MVAADVPTLHANLTVTSLRASESAQFSGPLVAFFQERANEQTGGATPDFQLQAPHLRMETDSVDLSLHAALIEPKFMPSRTTTNYTQALVNGLSNGPGYRFNVFSSDPANPARMTVSSGCAGADPSQAPSLTRIPVVAGMDSRPATTRDTSTALRWNCLDGASIEIKGDLMLSLWVWNISLTADGKTQELRSGPQQSSNAPSDLPDVSGVASREQELYLFATNGTLTVPVLTAREYTLLTGPGTQASALNFQLQGAKGDLVLQGTTRSLKGSSVTLAGEAAATLSGQGVGQSFQAHMAGSVEKGSVDGQALAITTVAPSDRFPWIWLVGGVGLVAVPVLMVPVVRRARAARVRRLNALFETGRGFLNSGQNEQARDVARKILDLKEDHARGHYLMAMSLGGLQDVQGALLHHGRASELLLEIPRERGLLGENALQAARTAAATHDENLHPFVVAWLEEALGAKPELRDELGRFVELQPFLRPLGLPDPDDVSFG